MIFVEYYYLDKNYKPSGSVKKEFATQGDFNSWYKTAKMDPHTIIEVRLYDPEKNPKLKKYYDRYIVTPTSDYMV